MRRVRIALTVDPELPVPPKLYGGIERVVDMLALGLCDRGHDVTVFAHPLSQTAGRLIGWAGSNSRTPTDIARNATVLAREVLRQRFDLVHSFSRIACLTPILPLSIPKLMTYQRAISPRTVRLGYSFSRGTLEFTAVSRWMMSHVEQVGRWSVIPNGVRLDAYTFAPSVSSDAPLVFLGRVEEIKGPHVAIEIAKRVGARLVIAGNIPQEKRAWAEANVLPHVDGVQIRYAGPVDDAQKNELLGQARALVMPILWEEPFGIVMAEAMACGTPVVGFARGAVPEVVEDGRTGFVCKSLNEIVEAAKRIGEIDRAACRARVEQHYSPNAVVEAYLELYRRRLRPIAKMAVA